MIRWLVLLFIFIHTLHAMSDNEILNNADKLMKTSNTSNQFRAYNDYKNLYLKAMVSDDDKLKTDSLNGIIKSGKSLHIDVSQYENKLIKSKSHKTLKDKKIKINKLLKLESIRVVDDNIILKFDGKLTKDQIKYSTYCYSKQKRYKYIFDIHDSMLIKSKTLRKTGINRIKLAQYNSNTLRLVIEDSDKIDTQFKQDSNQLVISLLTKSKDRIPKVVDKNKIIVIDAGHGGKDPGATGFNKYREKTIVLQIAKYLKKILKSRGYKVYMTRDRDKFIELSNRTEYANNKNADIFVSIHANSASRKIAHKASGIECFFLSPSRSKRAEKVAAKENSADMSLMNKYGKQSFLNVLNSHKIIASNKLAIDLQRGILGTLNKSYSKVKDSGVREGPFWVLVGAQMPAVLVETGFISNKTEAKRLASINYQKKFALGMANGIERYFINN